MQTISKKYIELANNDKGVTHLKVELYYIKGGMNYFTGTNELRGVYLSVTPVSRKLSEGKFWSESFMAFSGTKTLIIEMARFNKKKCESIVIDEEYEKRLISHVCSKNNIDKNLVVSN